MREKGQVDPLVGSPFHLSQHPLEGLACLEGMGRAEREGRSCEFLESGYGDSTVLDTRSLLDFDPPPDTLLSVRTLPLQYTHSCHQSFRTTQSNRGHSASKLRRKKDTVVHWKAKVCKGTNVVASAMEDLTNRAFMGVDVFLMKICAFCLLEVMFKLVVCE